MKTLVKIIILTFSLNITGPIYAQMDEDDSSDDYSYQDDESSSFTDDYDYSQNDENSSDYNQDDESSSTSTDEYDNYQDNTTSSTDDYNNSSNSSTDDYNNSSSSSTDDYNNYPDDETTNSSGDYDSGWYDDGQTTTGVNSVSADKDQLNMFVYKNLQNQIIVHVNKDGLYTISIIDISGITWINKLVRFEANIDQAISVDKIPDGVLLIRLENNNNMIVKKVIK